MKFWACSLCLSVFGHFVFQAKSDALSLGGGPFSLPPPSVWLTYCVFFCVFESFIAKADWLWLESGCQNVFERHQQNVYADMYYAATGLF